MTGINATKAIVLAVAKGCNAAGRALEDGKVSISDLVYLYEPMTAILGAFGGLKDVGSELADLDDVELQELYAAFETEFDLPQDGIEAVVERAVAVARNLVELFLAFRNRDAVG